MVRVVNVSFCENKILLECEKCNELNVGLSESIKNPAQFASVEIDCRTSYISVAGTKVRKTNPN